MNRLPIIFIGQLPMMFGALWKSLIFSRLMGRFSGVILSLNGWIYEIAYRRSEPIADGQEGFKVGFHVARKQLLREMEATLKQVLRTVEAIKK